MVSVVIGINWGNVGFTAAYYIFFKVYNSSFSKAPLHRPVLVFILSVLYHRIIILIQGATNGFIPLKRISYITLKER